MTHDKKHVQTFDAHGSDQLREADVIADDDPAADVAVQIECGHMVSLSEEKVFLHGREKMSLVIFGDALSTSVEDIRSVVDSVFLQVRNATGNNVHIQLVGKESEYFLCNHSIPVGKLRKVLPRKESDIPCLRQNNYISPSFGSLIHQHTCFFEVLIRIFEHHIHLDTGNFHLHLLKVCFL